MDAESGSDIIEGDRHTKYITRKELEDLLRGEYVRKESFERLKDEVDELRQRIKALEEELEFTKIRTDKVTIENDLKEVLVGFPNPNVEASRAIFQPILLKARQVVNRDNTEETVPTSVCSSDDQQSSNSDIAEFGLTTYTSPCWTRKGVAVSFALKRDGQCYMMTGKEKDDFLHFEVKAIPNRICQRKFIFYQTLFSIGNPDFKFESALYPGYYLTMQKECDHSPFKLFLKEQPFPVPETCKLTVKVKSKELEKSENCF